jgi:GNAT superfamily N-acetyltransferase
VSGTTVTNSLPQGLVIRQLAVSDLEAVDDLHRRSIAGLGADIVKPEKKKFFEDLLGGRGRLIGIEDDARLVAYGVLQHDLHADDNPREQLGVLPEFLLLKLAGSGVDHRYRGMGLQRLLIEERIALAGDRALTFATAAPLNHPSWINLLSCGLTVRALQYRYGGYPRFLMARSGAALIDSAPDHGHPGLEIASDDLVRQSECLSNGWRGIEAVENSPVIRYRPMIQSGALR